jgi:hypothetical protein
MLHQFGYYLLKLLYKKHADLSFGKLLRNYFMQKIGYTQRRASAFSKPASVNTLPT